MQLGHSRFQALAQRLQGWQSAHPRPCTPWNYPHLHPPCPTPPPPTQLGLSLFEALAQELQGGGYGTAAHTHLFREVDAAAVRCGRSSGGAGTGGGGGTSKPWAARAVLIDMEPKVCVV